MYVAGRATGTLRSPPLSLRPSYFPTPNRNLRTSAFQRGLKLEGNIELSAGLGQAYAASGDQAKALEVLKHLQEMAKNTYIAPCNRALIYAGRGEQNMAFEWLDRACNARSYLLVEYLNTDPRLDSLRADPRLVPAEPASVCPRERRNKSRETCFWHSNVGSEIYALEERPTACSLIHHSWYCQLALLSEIPWLTCEDRSSHSSTPTRSRKGDGYTWYPSQFKLT